MPALKKLVVALAIATAAGVALGALSRALMRVGTYVAGGTPGFSWSGTLFVLLLYVVAAAPVTVLAASTTRWWRWIAAVPGSGMLAVPGASISAEEMVGREGWSGAQWLGAAAVAVAIIATTIALPVITVRLVDRTVARAGLRQPRPAAVVAPAASAAA
jgi:hypothetical protein